MGCRHRPVVGLPSHACCPPGMATALSQHSCMHACRQAGPSSPTTQPRTGVWQSFLKPITTPTTRLCTAIWGSRSSGRPAPKKSAMWHLQAAAGGGGCEGVWLGGQVGRWAGRQAGGQVGQVHILWVCRGRVLQAPLARQGAQAAARPLGPAKLTDQHAQGVRHSPQHPNSGWRVELKGEAGHCEEHC